MSAILLSLPGAADILDLGIAVLGLGCYHLNMLCQVNLGLKAVGGGFIYNLLACLLDSLNIIQRFTFEAALNQGERYIAALLYQPNLCYIIWIISNRGLTAFEKALCISIVPVAQTINL